MSVPTIRRPTPADAELLFDVMVACDVLAIGRPDGTLDDVRNTLTDPALDLDRDGWVAVDPERGAVGCVFVRAHGESDTVDLDIYTATAPRTVADELWQLGEARAAERVRAFGHPQLKLDVGVFRQDEARRGYVEGRGYALSTSFFRMQIDFDGAVRAPDLPAGVHVEIARDDDALRRTAHAVEMASFADHYGFAERSFDEWAARLESSVTSSWDQVRIATVDGDPAALLVATSQYVEDENLGYVLDLGVLREHRGKGLGRFLLLDAFCRDAADGRAGTTLWVDVNNVTPALGLYESVGMRQVLVMDGWRKTVAV